MDHGRDGKALFLADVAEDTSNLSCIRYRAPVFASFETLLAIIFFLFNQI